MLMCVVSFQDRIESRQKLEIVFISKYSYEV